LRLAPARRSRSTPSSPCARRARYRISPPDTEDSRPKDGARRGNRRRSFFAHQLSAATLAVRRPSLGLEDELGLSPAAPGAFPPHSATPISIATSIVATGVHDTDVRPLYVGAPGTRTGRPPPPPRSASMSAAWRRPDPPALPPRHPMTPVAVPPVPLQPRAQLLRDEIAVRVSRLESSWMLVYVAPRPDLIRNSSRLGGRLRRPKRLFAPDTVWKIARRRL